MASAVARFWTWHNDGYVRLTVREGNRLNWSSRGPTDEGWSMVGESWWVDGDYLVNESVTDGRDCDGRHSTHGFYRCHFTRLAAFVTPDGVGVPRWELVATGQRDYAAEAAGY